MAWVISNWKGLVGGKKWVGVSWMRTHRAHTQALYTVTIKHTAHHTLPGNCLDIFIVETLTWKIQRLYHCDNPVPYSLMRLLWIKRNFVTLQKSFCSLHVSGARYNIGICVCRSFFYFKSGRKRWGLWVVLTVWEKRWLPLPLSIRVTMTGDGGENDFGFCSDAPLWRITLCCRVLAGPVSLACVTCTSRRVSHNNFVCACVCKCVRARERPCQWRICHACSLSRASQGSAALWLWSRRPFRGDVQDDAGSNKGWHPEHPF